MVTISKVMQANLAAPLKKRLLICWLNNFKDSFDFIFDIFVYVFLWWFSNGDVIIFCFPFGTDVVELLRRPIKYLWI